MRVSLYELCASSKIVHVGICKHADYGRFEKDGLPQQMYA